MIKIGYLVSYDYELLLISLKQVYDLSDKIYLSVDKSGLTWNGNKIEIPDSFFKQIEIFDTAKKIVYHYDDFYISGLTPMQCDTRQRNLLLKEMGSGWLIQLDVDEYVLNFKSVVDFLRRNIYLTYFPLLTPIVIQGNWISLFKKSEEGFFMISRKDRFEFITNYPKVTTARNNSRLSKFHIDVDVVHQSWARSEAEIYTKVMNWSHCTDFDTLKFLEFWKKINSQNYTTFKNFHPLNPNSWDSLNFVEVKNIDDFIRTLDHDEAVQYDKISVIEIIKKNIVIKYKIFKNRLERVFKKYFRKL